MTGLLKVFHFDVYVLLDPGATLSFVTPYVAMRFDVGLEILSDHFNMSLLSLVILFLLRKFIEIALFMFSIRSLMLIL